MSRAHAIVMSINRMSADKADGKSTAKLKQAQWYFHFANKQHFHPGVNFAWKIECVRKYVCKTTSRWVGLDFLSPMFTLLMQLVRLFVSSSCHIMKRREKKTVDNLHTTSSVVMTFQRKWFIFFLCFCFVCFVCFKMECAGRKKLRGNECKKEENFPR